MLYQATNNEALASNCFYSVSIQFLGKNKNNYRMDLILQFKRLLLWQQSMTIQINLMLLVEASDWKRT